MVSSLAKEMRRFTSCQCAMRREVRSVFFPRGVEAPKGAFIGNFPVASQADEKDFFNQVPFLCQDVSVADASIFLLKYDVGCVPVLHRSTKDLVGMISERDVARAVGKLSFAKLPIVEAQGRSEPSSGPEHRLLVDFHKITVEEIMSKQVVSIVQGTSLSEALMIMDNNNFRHLPVVAQNNSKRIVGLLSMRDIMHRHVKGEAKATTEDFMQWVLKMSS